MPKFTIMVKKLFLVNKRVLIVNMTIFNRQIPVQKNSNKAILVPNLNFLCKEQSPKMATGMR